jgi:hypothetical protein
LAAPPAICRHALDDGIDHVDVGEVLRVHRGTPGGGSQLVRRRATCRARAVDEDVDRSKLAFDPLDGKRGVGGTRQIGGDGQRRADGPIRLGQVGRTARHERQPGAFGSERFRAGQADALASAGDEDDAPAEVEVHAMSRYGLMATPDRFGHLRTRRNPAEVYRAFTGFPGPFAPAILCP